MAKYPILILHGWNLSKGKYQPLVDEFKKSGYEIEAIDLPGFGQSPLPQKPLVLSDYVNFVEKYIKEKRWKEVLLIGHSFGGRIGIKLASQNPSYMKALILTGTPGYNPVRQSKILFFLTLAKIGNIIFALPLLNNFKIITRRLLYKAARASDFYNTDINMQDTFKNIVSEGLVEYMHKINMPTLLIWGEGDKIVPLSIADKMKQVIPNSHLKVIKDARHGLPWTHPQIFADRVIQFLKDYVS